MLRVAEDIPYASLLNDLSFVHHDHLIGQLGNYAKVEMDPLSDLLAAIASEAEWLADGDEVRFMSEVARRIADTNS